MEQKKYVRVRHKCGAILAIPYQPGIENKKITCPACGKEDYFKNCTPYNDNAGSSGGSANGGSAGGQQADKEGTDILDENTQIAMGHLIVMNGTAVPYRYDLKTGRNVIGRKSSEQGIDLAIDTGVNKHISRKHIAIDVVTKAGSTPVFRVSLMKQRVNETRVNNMLLQYGDCILLKDGSYIQLPDGVRLQFVQDYKGGAAPRQGSGTDLGTDLGSEY